VSETESEDNRREATSVSPETTVERRIEGADVDWFAFDAESGQAVVAEFSRVRPTARRALFSTGPAGTTEISCPSGLMIPRACSSH
jgi:hypothetical protein